MANTPARFATFRCDEEPLWNQQTCSRFFERAKYETTAVGRLRDLSSDEIGNDLLIDLVFKMAEVEYQEQRLCQALYEINQIGFYIRKKELNLR